MFFRTIFKADCGQLIGIGANLTRENRRWRKWSTTPR